MSQATAPDGGGPIMAGGGVVWRGSPEPLVAVVHRPQHDDWVLPKGKLRDGETAIAAACREAQEETGCKVSVYEYMGSIAYQVGDRTKVVLFWRMSADSGERHPLESDVDKVEWLPLDAALKKLTHPLERHFLQTARSTVAAPLRRLRRLERLFETSTARLHQSIVGYEVQLSRTIANSKSNDQSWASCALGLVACARRALDQRDAETGWHCLKAATRMELYGLPSDEIKPRAMRLLSEASAKLGTWRANAMSQILLESGSPKGTPSASDLAAAMQLLHEHEDNSYRLLRIRWRHFAVLGISALLLLSVVVATIPARAGSVDLFQWNAVVHFAALGALGAAISGILRVGSPTSRRIPGELSAFGVLVARLAVGAAMAIFIVALWEAGFLRIADMTSPEFAIALAIAAGFSERLAEGAIGRLAGESSKDGTSSSEKPR